ncbi:MAG: Gldg family protein [Bacteroidales bacterium]|nr:Gldg family protein [Bacteroidales bacterium]
MKTIYKIAKAELQTLFYSPIAWFILIVFAFQTAMMFSARLNELVANEVLGYGNYNITANLFGGSGLFAVVQGYLYLYIPLLTMSLMSRELGSGAIKLLYSSPVTNAQIILGKYLSMMFYAFVLIGILMIYTITAAMVIKDIDFPMILTGMLGIYLLICAYSAIGLFMSSLTSYQVVAAVGTLTILALLTYVQGLWQDIAVVREITFWLGISGRANEFSDGLICSEDLLYFIIVVVLFLSMTIIHLQSIRQRNNRMKILGKYLGIWVLSLFLGYLSSRPVLEVYYDATRTKQNTLTENSQEILKQLEGGLTITTYTNMLDQYNWIALPQYFNWDQNRFRQYMRFKPEIKMKYVYYYDRTNNEALDKNYPGLTDEEKARKIAEIQHIDFDLLLSPEEIRQQIDLSVENNRFVRLLERENGDKTFLRIYDDPYTHPMESEISAAFKRLTMKLPTVGFVTGQGERSSRQNGDREYSVFTQDKTFRYSLINQGFDFKNVTLDKTIPEDIDILMIAEMKRALTEVEQENLKQYIERGGNLFIVGEPKRQEVMNPLVEVFGVRFMDGSLVHAPGNLAADLITVKPTAESSSLSYVFEKQMAREQVVTMPGTTGLRYSGDVGFEVYPLFVTDSLGVWNEIETDNFIDDSVRLNPQAGEVEQAYVTALALSRKINDKTQKIIILGDADCISNGELRLHRKDIDASNFSLITGTFHWLSDGEVPIDIRRPVPPDNQIFLSERGMSITRSLLIGGVPICLLIVALLIWIRRRGR